jgi:hypothetical protein
MTPLTKYDTAGASKFDVFWLLLKEISIKKSCIGKSYYTISTTFIQKIWGLTKDLHKYEAINEQKGIGYQIKLFDEKDRS